MKELEGTLRARIEALLGGKITSARPAPGGYSQAKRWIVGFDQLTVFAKIGTPPIADVSLRHEASIYEQLDLPCMPRVLDWEDDGSLPILLLEDLSTAHWPPPWTPESVAQVLETIDQFHHVDGPLQPFETVHGTREGWWRKIAADPSTFLNLDVVDGAWLRKSLPVLIEAESRVDPRGSAVTHFDLRSDNVCFQDGNTRIIDWSMACSGNPKLDLGFFLPGLASEGGPMPEEVLPSEAEVASWVAGFFAVHAAKPFIPKAPQVRTLQLRLLRQAMPWAIRSLKL